MADKRAPGAGLGGGMTVREAGRKGGEKVASERGHEFYEAIGKKGGQKVRELIARGKSRPPAATEGEAASTGESEERDAAPEEELREQP